MKSSKIMDKASSPHPLWPFFLFENAWLFVCKASTPARLGYFLFENAWLFVYDIRYTYFLLNAARVSGLAPERAREGTA